MPTDLRDAVAEAIVSHEWDDFPRSAHGDHNYYGACAICQGDVPRIAEVALAALLEDPGNLPARMSEAIAEKFTSPKRGKATEETDWEEPVLDTLAERADKGMAVFFTAGDGGLSFRSPTPHEVAEVALSVRDELVAHLAARAAKAEARVEHAEAGAQLSSERLAKVQQELAEMKRVTDPPADEEMPTDPAELREMWEFINRQARWQWHMAHKFGSQVERVRELHSPETDPRRTPDCKGCRTVATYTLYENCKTIAALNAETTTTPARETA